MAVRYRSRNGAARISVTQVLSLAGRINKDWFTPEAAERGSLVHALTEDFDYGRSMNIPGHVLGYLEAYASFIGTVRPDYSDIEVEVQCDRLQVAGRIDRVCRRLFGRPAILDLKTGATSPWHAQQLAGYNLLRAELVPRYTLLLRNDGRYVLKEHADVADYRLFLHDVACVRGTVYPEGDYWVPAS